MGLGRRHTNAAPPPARPRGEDPPPYTSRYLTEETQYSLAPVPARVQKVGLAPGKVTAWVCCPPTGAFAELSAGVTGAALSAWCLPVSLAK